MHCPAGNHLLVPNIFYPQFLDESDPAQRALGIEAGYVWWESADLIAFYTDLGWSPGMLAAKDQCLRLYKSFETRSLQTFVNASPGQEK